MGECASKTVLGMVIDALYRRGDENLEDCRMVISANSSYLREFRKELEDYIPPDEYTASLLEDFNESLGDGS